MSKALPFMILCVEEYNNKKGLTGKEVMDLFMKYGSKCKAAMSLLRLSTCTETR